MSAGLVAVMVTPGYCRPLRVLHDAAKAALARLTCDRRGACQAHQENEPENDPSHCSAPFSTFVIWQLDLAIRSGSPSRTVKVRAATVNH